MKKLLRSQPRKFIVYIWFALIIFILCYTELYVYYSNTYHWYKLKCNTRSSCTRILLVADPQLIGKHNEIFHSITPLSIYDSDRYLKKTYEHAFYFANPDVVIFLGDLMDEGSTATETEYKKYVRRLFNIFLSGPFANVKHIWLPGDNDIGGEGSDRITPEKIKKFNQAFSQPDIIDFKNITFYKINRLIQSIPKVSETREFYDTRKIAIGLSHLPLMFTPSVFADKVLTKLQPHLLFTAHEHKAMIINTDALLRQDRHVIPIRPDNNGVYSYTLGALDMYEILVPTCSYRMGTSKIGYGFAIVENTELQYTVLWSPSRFPQLLVYLGLIIATILFFSIDFCVRYSCRRKYSPYKMLRNVA